MHFFEIAEHVQKKKLHINLGVGEEEFWGIQLVKNILVTGLFSGLILNQLDL